MKTPADILGNVKTRGDLRRVSASSLPTNKPLTESVPADHPIWQLWRFMSEFYGAAFASQYGDTPNASWVHALRELEPRDYRRGIDLLTHRDNSFPPNPGEFVAMIGNDTSWERQHHKIIDTTHLIEDTTAKEKRCADGLDAIRALREQVKL